VVSSLDYCDGFETRVTRSPDAEALEALPGRDRLPMTMVPSPLIEFAPPLLLPFCSARELLRSLV
jgi:hypothetical protein